MQIHIHQHPNAHIHTQPLEAYILSFKIFLMKGESNVICYICFLIYQCSILEALSLSTPVYVYRP